MVKYFPESHISARQFSSQTSHILHAQLHPSLFSAVLLILPTHAAPGLLLPPAGTELYWGTGQAGCSLPCSRWEISKLVTTASPSLTCWHYCRFTTTFSTAKAQFIMISFNFSIQYLWIWHKPSKGAHSYNNMQQRKHCCWAIVWRFKQPWCSVMVAIYFFTFCTSHAGSVFKVMRFAVVYNRV